MHLHVRGYHLNIICVCMFACIHNGILLGHKRLKSCYYGGLEGIMIIEIIQTKANISLSYLYVKSKKQTKEKYK